jgi:hypothetical protein
MSLELMRDSGLPVFNPGERRTSRANWHGYRETFPFHVYIKFSRYTDISIRDYKALSVIRSSSAPRLTAQSSLSSSLNATASTHAPSPCPSIPSP